jgi:hypothetical protein
MQYIDKDDEDDEDDFVGDGYLTVGELKTLLDQIPDDMKVYLEKVDDVIYDNAGMITKEIPDPKSPKEMVYRFVRCLEGVIYDTDDDRRGLYLTAFENK